MASSGNVGRNIGEGSGAAALLAMELLGHSGGHKASHATRSDFALQTHMTNLKGALNEQVYNHSVALAGINHSNTMEAESHRSSLAVNEGYAARQNAMSISRQASSQEMGMARLTAHHVGVQDERANAHEVKLSEMSYKNEPLGNAKDRTEKARQFDLTHALKEKAFDRASDTLDALE